jgi:hypothetical protein
MISLLSFVEMYNILKPRSWLVGSSLMAKTILCLVKKKTSFSSIQGFARVPYANAGNRLHCSIEYSMWFILFVVNLMTQYVML